MLGRVQGVTISNDGATIMKLLEIVHPAAKTLVDISLSQDAEVSLMASLTDSVKVHLKCNGQMSCATSTFGYTS